MYIKNFKQYIKEDYIPGGLSTNMTIEQIAKKHNVSPADIQYQLEKGIQVELEHTSSKDQAREIAMDHLVEFPDYYDRLEKVEKEPV